MDGTMANMQPVVKLERTELSDWRSTDSPLSNISNGSHKKVIEVKKEIPDEGKGINPDIQIKEEILTDDSSSDVVVDVEDCSENVSDNIQTSDYNDTDTYNSCLPVMDSKLALPFRKPLELGWHREVVIRASSADPGLRKTGDVYYFTPTGKKLRSTPQIAAHLESLADLNEKTRLTQANFTFKKEVVHKPPFEVIRHAGERQPTRERIVRVNPTKSFSKPKEAPVKKVVTSTKSESRDVKCPEKTAAATAIVMKSLPPQRMQRAMEIMEKRMAPNTSSEHSNGSDLKVAEKKAETSVSTNPPKWFERSLVPKPLTARKSFATKRSISTEATTAPIEAKKPKMMGRICSMKCPGMVDCMPTLVCALCRRLFHHECVGLMTNVQKFVCQLCFDKNGSETGPANDVPDPVLAILQKDPNGSLQSDTNSMASVENEPLALEPKLTTSVVRVQVPPQHYPPLRAMRPMPKLVPRPDVNRSMSMPSLPTSLASPVPIRPSLVRGLIPQKMTPPPPLPIAPLAATTDMTAGGKRMQILPLPDTLVAKMRPIGENVLLVNSTPIVVRASDLVSTTVGVGLMLQPGTIDTTLPNHMISVALADRQMLATMMPPPEQSAIKIVPPNQNKAVIPKPNKVSKSKLEVMYKKAGKDAKVKKARVGPGEKCGMSSLLLGYESMLKILDFLPLPDLLRASRVCKTWQSIITNHAQLRHVVLEDCSVKDWQRFGQFLYERKAESLDLNGLELTGKFDKEWKKFCSIVPKLRHLRKLSLGQCPPSVLYTVAEELPCLETLHAEHVTSTDKEPNVWYTNASLDLCRLASFKYLRELSLRGMAGLNISSEYSGLQRLAQLKNLRRLSLTSMKNVDGIELSFLETLRLDELEIGDCDTWTEETYGYLNKLQLQILHLENCGTSTSCLVSAMPHWQTLKELDLIMICVDESLEKALMHLTGLESLSICPDTRDNDALTNRNTLLAVRGLSHLKFFLWCAVLAPNEEGEGDEMEFLEQGIEDSLYFGETGRPPPETSELRRETVVKPSRSTVSNAQMGIDEELALIEGKMDVEESDEDSEGDAVDVEESEADEKVEVGPEEQTDAQGEEGNVDEQQASSVDGKTSPGMNAMDTASPPAETLAEKICTESNTVDENTPQRDHTQANEAKVDSELSKQDSSSESSPDQMTRTNSEEATKKELSKEESEPVSEISVSNPELPTDSPRDVKAKPAKRRRKTYSDAELRRSNRKRKLKKSDDSSIAFVELETLVTILQFHLPTTEIRVDPITLK